MTGPKSIVEDRFHRFAPLDCRRDGLTCVVIGLQHVGEHYQPIAPAVSEKTAAAADEFTAKGL